jgi:hypothetical protein
MKPDNFPLAIFIAVAAGIFQTILLLHVDPYIAAYSPIPIWLDLHVATRSLFFLLLSMYIWIVSILPCLPVAHVLCNLRPHKLFVYLVLAVTPSFLWQHRFLFVDPARLDNPMIIFDSILPALFMLPAATAIVRFTSNNSFKPKPLRGSA